MKERTYRTCQNCGTVNLNSDHCKQCGELININLKRRLEREQRAIYKIALENSKEKNKITIFFEGALVHKNPFIRYPAKFLYSIWVAVMAIASFLAWLVGFTAG